MNLRERATSLAVMVLFAMGSAVGADEPTGTEPLGPHAEIDGCRVFVEPQDAGLVVRVVNPGTEPRTLRFSVAVSAMEMMSRSRVPAVPREIARFDLELIVPAGGKAEKTLPLDALQPKAGTFYSVSAIHGERTTPFLASIGGLKVIEEIR